jgi:RNA polymerase sigma-70 factor (ECF subfamily)
MSREKGMKIPEIAAELNLSPGYVKKALVLSLNAIRQHLAAAGKILSLLFALLKF